jgi:hypothetical protein
MRFELVKENGEFKVDNIRNYDNDFDSGYFDYMDEMEEYLDPNED